MKDKLSIYQKAFKLPLLYLLFVVVSILMALLLMLLNVEGADAALFAVLVQPAIPIFHTCMELGFCHVGGALSWWEFGPVVYATSMHVVFAVILYVMNFIFLKLKKGA